MTRYQRNDIMDHMDIERRLRQAAIKSELSIKRLAVGSGLPYGSVHGFVTDPDRTLTLRSAARLAAFLELELCPTRGKAKAKVKR
jgi:hypothetical protein